MDGRIRHLLFLRCWSTWQCRYLWLWAVIILQCQTAKKQTEIWRKCMAGIWWNQSWSAFCCRFLPFVCLRFCCWQRRIKIYRCSVFLCLAHTDLEAIMYRSCCSCLLFFRWFMWWSHTMLSLDLLWQRSPISRLRCASSCLIWINIITAWASEDTCS